MAAALSVLPAIAAVIDQQSIRALQEYALSMYGASGIDVDPGLLYAVIYTVAGTFVLFWLIAAVTSLIGRRLALCTGVVVVLLNVMVALTMLFATEYGSNVFPPLWGVLVGVPALVGAFAIVLIKRSPQVRAA